MKARTHSHQRLTLFQIPRLLCWPALVVLLIACSKDSKPQKSSAPARELVYTDSQFQPLSLTNVSILCDDLQECPFQEIREGAAGPDGRTYLAGQPADLIEFDSESRRVRVIGGVGSGPGEYRLIGPIEVDENGTLTILDLVGFRVVTFGPDGRHLNTKLMKPPQGFPHNIRLRDGRLFTLLIPPAASLDDTVQARFVEITDETMISTAVTVQTRARVLAGSSGAPLNPFFAALPLWDVDEELGMIFSGAADYRIDRLRADGTLDYSIRIDVAPLPVTDADIQAEITARLGKPPVPPEIRQSVIERSKAAPTRHPALQDIRIFGDLLFVKRTSRTDTGRWDVFELATGTPWGMFELSSTAQLLDADSTRVLISDLTEEGVPFAVWYRIVR